MSDWPWRVEFVWSTVGVSAESDVIVGRCRNDSAELEYSSGFWKWESVSRKSKSPAMSDVGVMFGTERAVYELQTGIKSFRSDSNFAALLQR